MQRDNVQQSAFTLDENKLFNPLLKQRYYNYYMTVKHRSVNSKSSIEVFLRRISKVEEMLGKNIFDFSLSNYNLAFDILKWNNKLSTRQRNLYEIKRYLIWCIDQGVCSSECYQIFAMVPKFETATVNKADSMYYSYQQIIRKAEHIFGDNGFDFDYYSRYIVLWFLMFNQCSFNDIATAEKTWVSQDLSQINFHHTQYSRPHWKEHIIEIPNDMTKYFESVLFATSYRNLANVPQFITPSSRLIPPVRKKIDKIQPTMVTNAKRILKTQFDIDGAETINNKDVEYSGVYYAMYQYFRTTNYLEIPINRIEECVVFPYKSPYRLREDYKDWVRLMPQNLINVTQK